MILIEDVDAFFQQRAKSDAAVKVSYAGFINALDGVAAHEGSVIFLTTNHPELIDEAATRSGRVDRHMELGLCDRDQLARMFRKFFEDEDAAARFAETAGPQRWSPAQVQEQLLKASSAQEAPAMLAEPPLGAGVRRAALGRTTSEGAARRRGPRTENARARGRSRFRPRSAALRRPASRDASRASPSHCRRARPSASCSGCPT